jgi:hypothetical protein
MDALRSVFDDPAVYRRHGAQNIAVMDATYPRNSRYHGYA